MIIDGFTFLGVSREGWESRRRHLLSAMDREQVAAAVVCPTHPPGHSFRSANDAVAADVAAAPERLLAMARVDPAEGDDAVAELERAAGELGARGVFLHPWEDSYSLARPEVADVVRRAAELGLAVMIAAGYPWRSEAAQVAALCRSFPEARFVITNGAQINISGLGQIDAANLAAQCPNAILLTNGVYRDDFLRMIVAKHGNSRLAFGSSHPLMDLGFERQRVALSGLSEADRTAVLGETLAELFGVSQGAEVAG